MRDPASRIPREDFFSISLFPWGKGNFFGEFPFLHVGREEIFLNFPSHMKKNQKKMNFYLLKWAKSVIFCEKGRDSFPTSHCGKKKISISLPSWGKGNFFGGFPFPHVGREEIVFSFSFSTATLIKSINQLINLTFCFSLNHFLNNFSKNYISSFNNFTVKLRLRKNCF